MDVLTKEQRRRNMQAIHSKNTRIEVILGKSLFALGLRYRKNNKTIFGKPDLTFKQLKIAVFVDSEYFHGKDWEKEKYRIKTNRSFWWTKIERNIERDIAVNDKLTKDGWKVIRFWGKDIEKNLRTCTRIIEQVIIQRKMVRYSEIRNKLKIEVDKNSDNRLAHLTHYFQNYKNGVAHFFKSGAKGYLIEQHEKLNILHEPEFQYYIPIKWDIPFPPPTNPKFKFIDLFAGIGGIRLAFQNLGGKCVFTSEWNSYSKKTYEANFGEVPFGDITKISENEIPDHDILLAGFPCQPFSIAGVSKKNALGRNHGFLDETQGTLFFDIARIIKHKKPLAFLLENVKNLVSHDKGKTFKVITETLNELGYSIHYKINDGKHFVPQHRERIIIVGFRKESFLEKEKFQFPKLPEPTTKIKDILEANPLSKYTLTAHLWEYLQNYAAKHKAKGNGFGFGLTDLNGISRTMSARYYKDGAEILIPQKGNIPRRLTPRECARLQGFPDTFIIPVSDNQAYRQFGNSVTVPLIQFVGKNIVNELIIFNGKHITTSHTSGSAI
jgi:DNA (cytosine-5)-methyltransferase 1